MNTIAIRRFRLAASLIVVAAAAAAGVTRAHADSSLSIQVVEATVPVADADASQTAATSTCPSGTTLVGGGIETYTTLTPSAGSYEPINGLVARGLMTSDGGGSVSSSGASSPASWTAFGGFSGQAEANDDVTGFAMCLSGDTATTQIVVASQPGPSTASTTENVTATCPSGSVLVGGGANVTPASAASDKPVGSYPSDSSGDRVVTSQPDSWTAVGESGGRGGGITTTALAVCSSDTDLVTQVVIAGNIGHPAGPGNASAGSDPIATATATCPEGTTMLGGGALAYGDDGGELQQGVHLRGSYPSDSSASPVGDGSADPSSWSTIVQSGGQATPGTDTFAYALCAQLSAATTTGTSGATGSTTKSSGGAGSSAGGSTSGSTSSPGAPPGVATTSGSSGNLTAPTVSKSVIVREGRIGSVTVGHGSAAVEAAWSASGLLSATATLALALVPSAISGKHGAPAGTVAVLVSVKSSVKHSVSRLAAPLDLRFAGAPGNVEPAFSSNGHAWTAVPQIDSPTLPPGFVDGYYRDSSGTLHIRTWRPGYFALLSVSSGLIKPLAFKLVVAPTLDLARGRTLGISVAPTLLAVVTVTLLRSGKSIASWSKIAKSPSTRLELPLPAAALVSGHYMLSVEAQAGTEQVSHRAPVSFTH